MQIGVGYLARLWESNNNMEVISMKIGVFSLFVGVVCFLPGSSFAQNSDILNIDAFIAAYDKRCACVHDVPGETDEKVTDRAHDRRHFGTCRKLASKARKVFQYLEELELSDVTSGQIKDFISDKKKELRDCARDKRAHDRDKKVTDKPTDEKPSDKPAHD